MMTNHWFDSSHHLLGGNVIIITVMIKKRGVQGELYQDHHGLSDDTGLILWLKGHFLGLILKSIVCIHAKEIKALPEKAKHIFYETVR
jgi:hypothetical protein